MLLVPQSSPRRHRVVFYNSWYEVHTGRKISETCDVGCPRRGEHALQQGREPCVESSISRKVRRGPQSSARDSTTSLGEVSALVRCGRVKRVDLRDLFGTEECGQSHHGSPLRVCITYARWRQVGLGHGSSALRRLRHCSDVSLLDAKQCASKTSVDAQSTRTQVQCLKCSVQ